MSEVKRYDLVGDMDGNCNLNEARMELSDDGVYVKHRDYEALQAKCAAMAVENAAFKDINAWCKTDAFKNMYREFKTAEAIGCCDIDCMHDAMMVAIMHAPKAPATDAFLAEVRASELDSLAGVAETMLVKFSNQSCSSDMHEVVGWKMVLQQANNRAANIRKGGEQK